MLESASPRPDLGQRLYPKRTGKRRSTTACPLAREAFAPAPRLPGFGITAKRTDRDPERRLGYASALLGDLAIRGPARSTTPRAAASGLARLRKNESGGYSQASSDTI